MDRLSQLVYRVERALKFFLYFRARYVLHRKRQLAEMTNENNPIYERNTLEFVTVALEYCHFVEQAGEKGLFDFVDKATKLLPLLYLKALLLPVVESEEGAIPELPGAEEMYGTGRRRIAALWGERGTY